MPKQPVSGSIASPGLLAHVTVGKYCDGMPLYRQEGTLKRNGVDIPRATHANWMLQLAALVMPLINLIKDHILAAYQLLNDNGSSMTSSEFTKGLERISIKASTTLPYIAQEQNGQQERFFSTVEKRLMSMLENRKNTTLKELHDATAAWMEMGYNRRKHEELACSPLEVFLGDDNIHRAAISISELNLAFARQRTRIPRRQDSTFNIEGIRIELPWVYRHIEQVIVRYAEWELSSAWLMNQDGEKSICMLFPFDVKVNSSGQLRSVEPEYIPEEETEDELPSLLGEMMTECAAPGLPPAYLTKAEHKG